MKVSCGTQHLSEITSKLDAFPRRTRQRFIWVCRELEDICKEGQCQWLQIALVVMRRARPICACDQVECESECVPVDGMGGLQIEMVITKMNERQVALDVTR